MDLFDENSLPGVITDVQPDEELQYDTSLFGTTDPVLVIGTAFNGPVGKVVNIYSPEYGEYVYGKVYNSTSRKEATLMAAVKDIWDRGCRTILGCRISGKDVYKDYELAADTNLKLRVKGLYPSNENKNVYMTFEKNDVMTLSLYKPAEKATIAEKKAGLVESSNSVLKADIDMDSNGIDNNSDLVELISIVNDFVSNNVLRLAIIDEDGNDVTLSSIEAKNLKVGDMFPGLYTIGRSGNVAGVAANTKLEPVFDEKPYESFEGSFYKKLSLNTNVARDLPIYSKDGNLNDILGISSAEEYEFLTVYGKIDEYFAKDNIDYEEVSLTDFDIYKRLGRGFADNAYIKYEEKTLRNGTVKRKFKVKPVTDKNTKRSELQDGIYSVLENVPCAIRVIAGIDGEKVVKGSLPKPDKFKFCQPTTVKLLNDSISITPKVNPKDLSEPISYTFAFKQMTEDEATAASAIKNNLYKTASARQATLMTYSDMIADTKEYKEGSIFLIKDAQIEGSTSPLNLLYSYNNGKFNVLHQFATDTVVDVLKDSLIVADGKLYKCSNEVTSSESSELKLTSFVEADKTAIGNKDYFIVSLPNSTFVVAKYQVSGEEGSSVQSISFISSLGDVMNYTEDSLLVSLCQSYNGNKVTISSSEFDFLTIEEVVELLNNNEDFQKLFTANVIDTEKAQDSIEDLVDDLEGDQTIDVFSVTFKDRKIGYDTSLLIPYKTEDTFARQVAQHCYYTSLKTASTHGIIGTKLLLNPSPESITAKVDELVSSNMANTLLAKKATGRTMLSKNNLPYYIGRKISMIVGQYIVNTDDNYQILSNMAPGYAGMISVLPLDQSSTCQPIDIPNPVYEFTAYQLEQLTKAGFVTVKNSFTKGWVITDGITMAPAESEFRRLSCSRISDYVAKLIREACEPFIGKENHLANQNSLRTAIKSKLDNIVGTYIENYSFDILINANESQLGKIKVPYKIVPIYEIVSIENSIKVGK